MSEPPPVLELVSLAKRRVGVETDVDLWRTLGLDRFNTSHSRMKKFREGTQPNYNEAWALLEACGMAARDGQPIGEAEVLVRLINAGEEFRAEDLEPVVSDLDQIAGHLRTLRNRLRRALRAVEQAS